MSNEIIGRDIEVGVAVGENAGSPSRSIQKTTANIFRGVEHAEDDTTRGSIIASKQRRVVQHWLEGSIGGIIHADAIGYFLANLWGTTSSGAESNGTYEHTITLDDDHYHTPLSLWLKEGTDIYDGEAVQVNSLEVTAGVDDYLRYTAELIGEDLTTGSSFTPSYEQEVDFIGKDITIKVANTKAGLSSATAVQAKEVTINQNRNLERNHVFNNKYTPETIYGPRFETEISMTLNRVPGTDTYKDLFEGDGEKYVRITIEGSQDISDNSSDVNPKLEYTFYKAQVTGRDKTDDADALVEEQLTIGCYMQDDGGTDDGKLGEVTLVNNTEDYDEITS